MIKIAAAAAVAASIVFAPAAYADDDSYLDELSGDQRTLAGSAGGS